MTSSIPPSPSNPDRSNPPDLPAVASAVDRSGEVARLRDDLQPLRAVPLRLDHLERAVTADSSAAPAWAAGVERGLDELAGTVRGALAEMAAAVDSSLTALAESLRSRPLASPPRADPGASGVPVATVLEAAERIVGREIGELRDDLADALEEVLGQVSAQLTATSEELRSTLADLAGPANPTDSAGPRSVADPVVPRPAAGRAGAPEEYAVEAPRRDQPDQDASAGVRVSGERFAGAGANPRLAEGSGRELRRAGTRAGGDGAQAGRPDIPRPGVSSPVSASQGPGSDDPSTEEGGPGRGLGGSRRGEDAEDETATGRPRARFWGSHS